MKLKNIKLMGTTNASGDKTVDSETAIYGQLYAVEWTDGDLADGVDGTLTVQHNSNSVARTLLTLTDANNDAFYYPRHVVHSEAGAALTGTSGGDREMPLIDGILRLVIAQGGDTKTGGMTIHYFEGDR